MRSFRLLIACAILLGAGTIAKIVAGPDIDERPPMRPVELMLVASIVGLGIAVFWLWICSRAGR